MLAIENRRTAIAALVRDQRPADHLIGHCIIGRAFHFGTIDYDSWSEKQKSNQMSEGDAEVSQIVHHPFIDG